MKRKKLIVFAIVSGLVLIVALSVRPGRKQKADIQATGTGGSSERSEQSDAAIASILADHDEEDVYPGFAIEYPRDRTLFPPEIVAPTFRWTDRQTGSDEWLIRIDFADGKESVFSLTQVMAWQPTRHQWESIKARSVDGRAQVTILGIDKAQGNKIVSRAKVSISTSTDEAGAPIFYRDVPLPFLHALKNMQSIKWRLGDISSREAPRVVLENLPVCGNCHSFSADGKTLGMDVDYANDKGSYVICPVDEEMVFSRNKVITWSDFQPNDNITTFGLLSQVSPDGRYVVSTVKDLSVFVPVNDLHFSQLFFPVQGILAVYDRQTATFHALPGADDPEYVQSNPAWSPDGEEIVFARAEAIELNLKADNRGRPVLPPEEAETFVKREKLCKYDLYRIPFNGGKGGKPQPITGASNNGMSNYFPKFSPDGKWIVFTRAKSFMLLQPDSELYIIPAHGGRERRMNCNTPRMNSWHSWSPNGKWLVFASKSNSAYTQLFLTHIDPDGNDTPAVLLENFTELKRAANIPEFVNIKPDGILRIRERFVDDHSYVRSGTEFLTFFKDLGRAKESFEKALELNPDNPDSHYSLGAVFFHKGEDNNAQKEFQKALQLGLNTTDLHYYLGNIHAKRGDFTQAEREYRAALELDPNNAVIHSNLGTMCAGRGDYDEAAKEFQCAVKLVPRRSEFRANLGAAYVKLKNHRAAEDEFRVALEINPDNAKACFQLAELLLQQNRLLDEAIALTTRGLAVMPANPDGHVMLGNLYLRLGKIDSAITQFERAARFNPKQADALRAKINELKQRSRQR